MCKPNIVSGFRLRDGNGLLPIWRTAQIAVHEATERFRARPASRRACCIRADKALQRGRCISGLERSDKNLKTGHPAAHALARYRCFLPDLAGLAGLRRAGPGVFNSNIFVPPGFLKQLMIQGEAGLRAEPAASRLTNPTTSRCRSGLERSDKITVTLGHRRADCALLRPQIQRQ